MKRVFIDTSALYALLDGNDAEHLAAKAVWTELLNSDVMLITSNYILIETSALLQNRLGLAAVRVLTDDLVPLFDIRWIDREVHRAAVNAHITAATRHLSLVDCSSFEVMRQSAATSAFTLDRHFREYGFHCMPE